MLTEVNKAGKKSSDWLTPENISDPSPLPAVRGWMMMVRPVTVAQKTKGGIIMPDTVLDDVHRATTVGRVLAMGNLCYKHPQFQGDVWCKVGDFVSYGKFDGIHYLFKGVKVMLIQDKDVRMVLENPQDIDPNFNLANY